MLNYLIISGAVLLCISVLVYIPTTNPSVFLAVSKTTPWFLALGFSLCYGTIVMKMFRVYYIVNDPLPNKVKTFLYSPMIKLLKLVCYLPFSESSRLDTCSWSACIYCH